MTEFGILRTLLREPGKVFTRDELMTARTTRNVVVSDRTIDSHVRRVRQKFAAAGGDVIETVHGVGYRLDDARRRVRRPRAADGCRWRWSLLTFVLSWAGLVVLRVYDNQLLRQTETELHRPGRVRGCGCTARRCARRAPPPTTASRWPPRWPLRWRRRDSRSTHPALARISTSMRCARGPNLRRSRRARPSPVAVAAGGG